MSAAQAVAVAIVAGQALFSFLLTQPDVVLPPLIKLVIGGANVVAGVVALYLKVNLPGRETTS